MANARNALLCAFPAAWANWIAGHVDICAIPVLMTEPRQISRCKHAFQRHNALHRGRRLLTTEKNRDRLVGCKTPDQEICRDLVHDSPQRVGDGSPAVD